MNFMRSPRAKAVLLSAATIGATVALVSCSASPTQDPRVRWGKSAEVINLDPQVTGFGTDWELQNLVYEQLVSIDKDQKPAPELASSWEKVTQTTYVFTLRDDVAFSNGRSMTASDVVGSLQRVMDPATGSPIVGNLPIKSIAAMGERQVSIDLTEPSELFLPSLASTSASILPIEELKAGTFNLKNELLGTGPYMSTDHVQGSSWSFSTNPHYWGTPPRTPKLDVQIITDETARIAAMRSGSIDFSSFQTPDALALLKNVPGLTSAIVPSSDYYRLDVNAISGPFSDLKVRQALALAIERNDLSATALGGSGEPASTATPAGLPGSCSPEETPLVTKDIEGAKKLLTDAGALGISVRILATTGDGANAALAQVLQQQLNAAGFKASIEQPESGVFLEKVFGKNPDFDLSISWYGGGADAGGVLPLWNPTKSQFNARFVIDHPDLNAAIASANSTSDARAAKLQVACDMIATEANVIPLATRNQTVAYNSDRIEVSLPSLSTNADPFGAISNYVVKK